jgi:hypothetical protein
VALCWWPIRRLSLRQAAGSGSAGRRGEREISHRRQYGLVVILLAMLADEVEDQTRRLAGRMAQAAPELLEEDRRARGRPQEQQHVDEGQVDALVIQVAGEHQIDVAITEPGRDGLAQGGLGTAVDRDRR